RGMSADAAAYHGARQVWAPILGSAQTTVIVFIPVLLLALPVGQLFRDIGIAISVSVLISMVVSVTVIPSLASRLLRGAPDRYTRLVRIPGLDHIARGFAALIVAYARTTVKRSLVGVVVVALVVAGALGFSVRFMPQLDYLPDGNANFAFGRIFTPPGYSLAEPLRIAEKMESAARPLWETEPEEGGPPAIERFFFVAFSGGAFAGASAKDPSRVSELQLVLSRPIFSEPGTGAFVRQASLFGRSVGGSRSIRIDISGPSREAILPIAFRVNERIGELFTRTEGNQVRALPNLDNGAPQIRITPDLAALARVGVSVRDVTSAVDVFNDGANVIQIPIAGELIDLVVAGKDASKLTAAELGDIPVVTRSGSALKLGQLAEIEIISAPQQIRRISGRQAISLRLRPTEALPLEKAVALIAPQLLAEISPPASAAGVSISLSGAASALNATWAAMQANVMIALGVIFLLMVLLL
ncbi:MAG: efflux RND transporter permease subunit, partial [SAR116 cluster bacterium]|nr:efflux RND transporter permease subunit [SAR116 cluster bacterium]